MVQGHLLTLKSLESLLKRPAGFGDVHESTLHFSPLKHISGCSIRGFDQSLSAHLQTLLGFDKHRRLALEGKFASRDRAYQTPARV